MASLCRTRGKSTTTSRFKALSKGAVCPHGPLGPPPEGIFDQKKDKIIRALAIIASLLASPIAAQEVAVPSGRVLTMFDVIIEQDLARFRFLLPEVAQDVEFEDIVDDLDYVCAKVALPALTQAGSDATQLVISVSAAEVPFGEATEIVQYFQPFYRDGDACIWEDF